MSLLISTACGGGGGSSVAPPSPTPGTTIPPTPGSTPTPSSTPRPVPTPAAVISGVFYQPSQPPGAINELLYIYASSTPAGLSLTPITRQPNGLRVEQRAQVGSQSFTDVLTESDPNLTFGDVSPCPESVTSRCYVIRTSRIVRPTFNQLSVDFSVNVSDVLGRIATATIPTLALTRGVATINATTAIPTSTLLHAYYNPEELNSLGQRGFVRVIALFTVPTGIRADRSIVIAREVLGPAGPLLTGELRTIDSRSLPAGQSCATATPVCAVVYTLGPISEALGDPAGLYQVNTTMTVFDGQNRSTSVLGSTSFQLETPTGRPTPSPLRDRELTTTEGPGLAGTIFGQSL